MDGVRVAVHRPGLVWFGISYQCLSGEHADFLIGLPICGARKLAGGVRFKLPKNGVRLFFQWLFDQF